jgi:hypothetical protein
MGNTGLTVRHPEIRVKHMAKRAFTPIALTPCTDVFVYKTEICIKAMFRMLCLRPEDAFVINCVANLMEVKVLYVQQDLRYEISSYWRFSV